MSALDDVYCIGNNEYKTMRSLIGSYRELEQLISAPVIDAQTIMFWTLQLQFMEMRPLALKSSYHYMCSDNEHYLMYKSSDKWTEKDCYEIVTHLALQLSGLA